MPQAIALAVSYVAGSAANFIAGTAYELGASAALTAQIYSGAYFAVSAVGTIALYSPLSSAVTPRIPRAEHDRP